MEPLECAKDSLLTVLSMFLWQFSHNGGQICILHFASMHFVQIVVNQGEDYKRLLWKKLVSMKQEPQAPCSAKFLMHPLLLAKY